jgi:hypothetical protein
MQPSLQEVSDFLLRTGEFKVRMVWPNRKLWLSWNNDDDRAIVLVRNDFIQRIWFEVWYDEHPHEIRLENKDELPDKIEELKAYVAEQNKLGNRTQTDNLKEA